MNLDLGDTRLIIDECAREKLSRKQAAYVLATSYWETAKTMKPVREAFWKDEDWRRRNLRYYPYYGRGFVQLTWRANYIKAGKVFGRKLAEKPDDVMEPEISAKILVRGSKEGWFTGKKLGDYLTDTKTDYVNARRIINGTDKASTIAKLAGQYEAVLSGYKPGRATHTVPAGGIVAAIANAIASLIKALTGRKS